MTEKRTYRHGYKLGFLAGQSTNELVLEERKGWMDFVADLHQQLKEKDEVIKALSRRAIRSEA